LATAPSAEASTVLASFRKSVAACPSLRIEMALIALIA
jgi:hypothetical protein